jgi:predicted nucleotidyltransferase
MDLAKIVSDHREQILGIAAKHGARDVRVFGSVARGEFKAGSDIDILIRLDSSKLEGMRYFGVLEELREELETALGQKVDVVDEKSLRETIKDEVLQQAIAL